ncbi:PREDICTED: protein FAR1-RELATED SEQUENCE 2-like [Ipomoea nil]|uniref:protein FAR1-RELATED SEQUENCE 2-like n=1 Tax=Ipomoea nil TaxID=35883 RepID=UPI0009014668|nr:PREDICTED: protein FAR1-RELATED SEQUENCE 2-like [Ipomoea nil]
MKVAIGREFPESRHRYCMWHIMTKVGDKVSTELARNEEFRQELNVVVWNDRSTSEYFEAAWKGVIERYGLLENAWLKHPPFKTQLRIERAKASVYTLTVFYEVQEEICARCFQCRVRSVTHGETGNTYVVEDAHEKQYMVFVENGTKTMTCTCRMYTRIGLLCSHAFAALIYERIEHIPPQHITPRWTRTAISNLTPEVCNDRPERDKTMTLGNKEENTVINTFYMCLGLAQGNVLKLEQIGNVLEEIEATWCESGEDRVAEDKGKRVIMEMYCGVPAPELVIVHPPVMSTTKGSGK